MDMGNEERSIRSRFQSLAIEVIKPGGVDMAVVGRLFSPLRAIGVKMPIRLGAY